MSSSRLFKLGIFFLAAFGMLAYFTLFLYDQQWFGSQTVLRVEFPEANGLRVGDGVRVSGMRIGRVTRMSFDQNAAPERRISVALSLEEPIVLREGYAIQIGETTLLGGRNIDILTGPQEASPIELTGDTVLTGRLEPSPLAALSAVGDLVTDNREFVRSILENFDAVMAGLRAGEGTLGRLIADEEMSDKVGVVVDDVSVVVGDLRAGKGTLGKLLVEEELHTAVEEVVANLRAGAGDLKLILADVEAGKGSIGKLVRDEELGEKLATAIEDLQGMISRASAGEGTVGRLFADDKIANDLEQLFAKLNSGEGALGALISSDEMYQNLNTALEDISTIVATVRDGEGTIGKLIMNEEVYQEILAAVRLLTQSLEDYREAAPVSTFTSVLFGAF